MSVADNPRIEELRRRVQRDPSSIAFAQLGEEYRRAGHFDEAIKTCRTGLARHPSYLSARVTLGRALIETREFDAAEAELSVVLKAAPENLAAIRGLADVHHQRGDLGKALTFYRRALALAKHDPDLEQTVDDIERITGTASGPAEVPGGLSFEQAQDEFMSFAPPMAPAARQEPTVTTPAAETSPLASDTPDLESVLDLEALMMGDASAPAEVPGELSVEQASDEFMSFAPPIVPAPHQQPTVTALVTEMNPPVLDNPDLESLSDLEAFLDAITVYRQGSASSS